MAEALGTVHACERGLLRGWWLLVGPKLVFDHMAEPVPEIMDTRGKNDKKHKQSSNWQVKNIYIQKNGWKKTDWGFLRTKCWGRYPAQEKERVLGGTRRLMRSIIISILYLERTIYVAHGMHGENEKSTQNIGQTFTRDLDVYGKITQKWILQKIFVSHEQNLCGWRRVSLHIFVSMMILWVS